MRRSPSHHAAAKFPFLEDYDMSGLGKNNICTLINKKYSKINPSSVDYLIDILQDPGKFEHQRFVIKGYILSFNSSKVEDIVKKTTGNSKRILGFKEKVPEGEQVNHIFHLIANVKDASVESGQKSLNIYILTNEEDKHIFDLWELLPGQRETSKWKVLEKSVIAEFEKRLSEVYNSGSEVKLVVELLITTGGKAFFKLYDTIFI